MVLQQIEKQKQKQKKQYKHLRTYAHTREAIYVLLSVIVNSITCKTVSLNTQLITKTNAKQSVHIGYESDHSNVAKHDNEHAQC